MIPSETYRNPAMADDQLPAPVHYLKNWREILNLLQLPNAATDRGFVAKMNRHFAGPIHLPGRGGQPFVAKAKLIEWWNRLEILWETQGCGENAAATVKATHNYGRTGTVVPAIRGHVRKKRRSRKSRKPSVSPA